MSEPNGNGSVIAKGVTQWVQWVLSAMVAILSVCLGYLFVAQTSMSARLAVMEGQQIRDSRSLEKIDEKLDRLIEKRP